MNEKRSEKRKPNWTLCVKEGERWRNIGAAWESEKGNLFLKLNDGETLRGIAMLFPYRERPEGGATFRRPVMRPAPVSPPPLPAHDDDYMERKRRERARSAPSTPARPVDDAIGIENPDVEPPPWLE